MRIGEAAAAAGVTAKAIRFYETRGLLPATGRSTNGYREYGPEAVSRLGFIVRCRAAGLSLTQIRDILAVSDLGEPPCAHVAAALGERLAALDVQIAELTALRSAVARLHAAAGEVNPSTCDAGRVCSSL